MGLLKKKNKVSTKLSGKLKPLFWDYDFEKLRWDRDHDLIVARILALGNWEAITWLRLRLQDEELREWILDRHGARLSPRQIRFWELILGLPHRTVNSWLKPGRQGVWEKRVRP